MQNALMHLAVLMVAVGVLAVVAGIYTGNPFAGFAGVCAAIVGTWLAYRVQP